MRRIVRFPSPLDAILTRVDISVRKVTFENDTRLRVVLVETFVSAAAAISVTKFSNPRSLKRKRRASFGVLDSERCVRVLGVVSQIERLTSVLF